MENRRFLAAGFCLLLLLGAGCTAGRRQAATPRSVPERPEGVFHVVQAGQTLWRIARAYGIALEALAETNGIDVTA